MLLLYHTSLSKIFIWTVPTDPWCNMLKTLERQRKYIGIILSDEHTLIQLKWTKSLKDTHREKAPSNKTSALTKSTNMDVWIVGTSDQLF